MIDINLILWRKNAPSSLFDFTVYTFSILIKYMSLPSNMTWPPVDQFYIVISLCLFVIGISLVLVYDWYYFLGLRTMRRAVTHFTRTWIMWSKVLAQRHTHTESPPTFFIPLNCKTKQTRSFIFFLLLTCTKTCSLIFYMF